MSQFSDSSFDDRGEASSFLSLVGIAFVLLTAGVSLAVLVAAA